MLVYISFDIAEEVMKEFRHNGQDYEYCPELENPESSPMTVRRKKKKFPVECVFCKNNGEESTYYKCHVLRDADGIVRCPVLRAYTCPICGVKGDHAHTIKYCPGNKNDEVVSFNSVKSLRNSIGKRRSK
ncbi:nanos homolog 2-like isoform X2 [Aphidius gifuensis]|uniref:nanos homolog 2-like isoform X2 n=1 Tax=Aphidius gifuensis TaxID=684658 RepID=UPI001CDB4A27|nr:nanos homolog 2-like isoform X2 [Aphidius gifuensis]